MSKGMMKMTAVALMAGLIITMFPVTASAGTSRCGKDGCNRSTGTNGTVYCDYHAAEYAKKEGYKVSTRDFIRIGIPFTLIAALSGAIVIWLIWA